MQFKVNIGQALAAFGIVSHGLHAIRSAGGDLQGEIFQKTVNAFGDILAHATEERYVLACQMSSGDRRWLLIGRDMVDRFNDAQLIAGMESLAKSGSTVTFSTQKE